MPAYVKLTPPATGEKIARKGTVLTVPDHPVIPMIPETEYLKGFAFEVVR